MDKPFPVNTRLILLYGAGSGIGKSTLGRAITAQLSANDVPTRFMEEHDILAVVEFQEYIKAVQQEYANDTNTLVICCQAYIQSLEMDLPEVIIMDSIFPCWDWLASANCTDEEVLQFSEALNSLLAPFNPILIIVDGDVSLALSRAIVTRGESWALSKAEQRTGVRKVEAYCDYLIQLREAMEIQLKSWPYKMIRVNTTNQSIDQSTTIILNQIKSEVV